MRPFRWDDDRVRMVLLAGMMRHGCGADAIVQMPGFVLKESFQDESEWAGYAEMVDECGAWGDEGGHESNRLCDELGGLVGHQFNGLSHGTYHGLHVFSGKDGINSGRSLNGLEVYALDHKGLPEDRDERTIMAVLPGVYGGMLEGMLVAANIVYAGGCARAVTGLPDDRLRRVTYHGVGSGDPRPLKWRLFDARVNGQMLDLGPVLQSPRVLIAGTTE